MPRVYVTLDLETTGLNPEHDAITEVGAVRFRGSQVFDEFQTLVNPGQAIPYQIQQLTGISNEAVAQAPKFEAIKARLQRFVGDSPIIGHNIGFDLSFLKAHNLFEDNPSIDTFELASILLPHADRYSLKALAAMLGVAEPPTHRALDDARVTQQLFQALLDQARQLNPDIIEDVAKLGARSRWSLAPVFQDLAREHSTFHVAATPNKPRSAETNWAELNPLTPPQKLNETEMTALLETGGLINQAFPQFEHRPQQVNMLRAVVDAFNYQYHLLVEAGTGTGKSMAYLLPAIKWATQNQSRVVISTNTINLQDQILHKDLPDLKQALHLNFNAVALKGRANYVCPRRVAQLRQKPNLNGAELRLLAKIAVWMPNTHTGDKQELFIPNYAEQAVWSQVNSNADICRPQYCTPEKCFFARARQAAEKAHLIIVNHALLLADIAVNNRAIPEYNYLIVDEAHHLEESVTQQLSFAANHKFINQLLNELTQPQTSLFAEIERAVKAAGLPAAISEISRLQNKVHPVLQRTTQAWERLFQHLAHFINQATGNRRQNYDQKLRISAQVRRQAAWSNVEMVWDEANLLLKETLHHIRQASRLWDATDAHSVEDWEQVMLTINNYRTQLEEIKQNVEIILGDDDPQTITWIEQKISTSEISLHAAPLHVGSLVRTHLFDDKSAIILTSATIRTDNSFEYIKERLSAWDLEELAVGSPFDYQNNTLLYIPTDIPEPNNPNYQKVFSQTLIDLAKATQGRMLVLFTAYSHLRSTAKQIVSPLAEADIVVYQQGSGASRRQLLESFKTANRAVLLGTRSFWEGVDVPGQNLSCVVIAKIPFSVPSDPIFQARSETFDNAFAQYSIPEAVLHFRQGFGRLIRTRSDVGVVVIMDRRVLSKNYGRVFLDSLPETTRMQGLSANLPHHAAEWLSGVR